MNGPCRQTKNIWWYLFGFYNWKGGKWRGREFFDKRFWSGGYIWHDSCLKFLNRWVFCHCIGYKPKLIKEANNKHRIHCFKCGQDV